MPRGKSKKKQLEEKKINTIVLIMIILAILSGVLIYMKPGVVGENASPALGGVLGYIKYLIPPGLFLMGVYFAINKELASFPKRLWKFIAILILVDAILACYQFSQQPPLIDCNGEFGDVLSRAYELGSTDIGGGILGLPTELYKSSASSSIKLKSIQSSIFLTKWSKGTKFSIVERIIQSFL